MATRHFYMGIENINLNIVQRQVLIDELKTLGPASNPQPARLCHWRTRLDGEAAIFEALFDEDNLTIAKFKQRLGSIFSVDSSTISHSTLQKNYAGFGTPIVTFTHGGIDYLSFALFGNSGASWLQSGDECRGYLKANQEEWSSPL